MKIAFQTNTLNYRGTTVAITDYARYNQEILGNESIILYPKNFNDPGLPIDSYTQQEVLKKLQTNFHVVSYESNNDLENIIKAKDVDYTYFIKWGFNDGVMVKNSKNIIHAVFQSKDPHGDRYAYISKWLSDYCSNGTIDYVPHIVDLPTKQVNNIRELLNISKDKIVIGRYGGYEEFDIPFVKGKIVELVEKNPEFVFVFINTKPFINHQNIIFLGPIIEKQDKTDFILSCDAMIHARQRGESFGLAICEFLFHNKPVLAWENGLDKHHIELLKHTNLLYNENNITEKFLYLKEKVVYNYSSLVEQFSVNNVMNKFNEVFLK